MAKSKIKINKTESFFTIEKDKNFDLFFSISVVFYQKIVELTQKNSGLILLMNPKFQVLMSKLSSKEKNIELSSEELKLMMDWNDCLCLIMLDLDTIDFKNKDIKKYLSLSERFIKDTKELIEN